MIRDFYQRLVAAGKKPNVALAACMRMLLCILDAMVKNGTRWAANGGDSRRMKNCLTRNTVAPKSWDRGLW